MIYNIVFDPNTILHTRSFDVDVKTIQTAEMQKLIKDMIETMYAKDGVGLAAPQIGKSLQMCIIAKAYNKLDPKHDLCLINPVFTKLSIHQAWDEEGCLSVPKIYGKIKRYTKIKVTALNIKGETIEFEAENFFARIIQHEIDHLNGHLFIEKAKNLYQIQN